MSKHLGNLTVTKDNLHSFPATDEIYGHLTIAAGAELRAPRLTMVRGWVTVQGHLVAPMLGLVDGWMTLANGSQINALNLNEVRQDLIIGETLLDLPALQIVSSLTVQRDVGKNLLALTEVRENIALAAGSKLGAPLLERIGRSITMREESRLDAPNLNHIGGYADIDESAVLSAPKFVS